MSDETTTPVVELPAPKSAADHVAQSIDVLPRPHEERSDAGVLHPAHRAS